MDARIGVSWQSIALDLLRRLAGAAPALSTDQLRAAGAAHDQELLHRGLDSLYFGTCHLDHPRQRLYQVLWKAQVSEARAVIDELKQLGTESIVFKGIEIGTRYRPAHGLYVSLDIDLLVPGSGLWSAEKILYGRGYTHSKYARDEQAWKGVDPIEAFRFEAAAYELMPFVKGIRVDGLDEECLALARRFPRMFSVQDDFLLAYVRFDIHHNILFNFNITPFWKRTVASSLGTGRTFCSADHLWFLLHRYYFEVAMGSLTEPRVLVPIAAMVSDPDIDWPLLVRNAVECNTTAPCLYWLTFFHRLGAPGVPERVIEELRSHHGRSERTWGWQLGRLLDVIEPFPDSILT